MKKLSPRVFTIAPGQNFLPTLARAILAGHPLSAHDAKPPLSAWTILLPTRRAERELKNILVGMCGKKTILLPRIKPIGDLDEDRLDSFEGDIPQAISTTAQIFILLDLLKEWASQNPHLKLAQEISNSPTQSFQLALSLQQLLNQVETEEANFDNLSEVYLEDLSEHRNSILGLIGLVKTALPQRLYAENKLGPAARRSHIIKLEAQNIASVRYRGPIIAAGSTGTISATRALLKAIAEYSHGSVILPGLDQTMEDESWQKIEPEHPQYSLKVLIESLNIERKNVEVLGSPANERHWLTSEIMRPAATAENWQKTLFNKQTEIATALQGVNCLEAASRHLEARAIAIILRQALEKPHQTAALVTPDRDLAKRVKSELQRWNITIDDSAGEPLSQYGLADLTIRLFNAVKENFSSSSLLNLLTHPDCDLGLGREQFLILLQKFEIAILRGYGGAAGIQGIEAAFNRAFQSHKKKVRTHPLVRNLNEEDWQNLNRLTLQVIGILRDLATTSTAPLIEHLKCLKTSLTSLAPNVDYNQPENIAFSEIIFEIESDAFRHPTCGFDAAAIVIGHKLRTTPHRNQNANQHRLAIYGVLEARLLPVDILVLGGLNETKWPAQPDTGPWLNRNMRKKFGLQQPEREIGVSAHDFAQGFGYSKVFLTWSKRIDGVPQIPSRWVLRLQTVLQAVGIELASIQDLSWLKLAREIDKPAAIAPFGKPKPTPPLLARPTHFSASSVEKLIRDPYAIYASKILRLEPLQKLVQQADPALRGTLFHEAIHQWNRQNENFEVKKSLEILVSEGRKIFEPFSDDTEISSFWWPRFVGMAQWLVSQEQMLQDNIREKHSEITGEVSFEIQNKTHHFTARADRIDRLVGGGARVIDYKTGKPPTQKQVLSGMSPQLPLEAALLAESGYKDLGAMLCLEMIYLQINGQKEGGTFASIKAEKETLAELGNRHFASFKKLLSYYLNVNQPYYPRAYLHFEDENSDYDHLSRFDEWILAGQT